MAGASRRRGSGPAAGAAVRLAAALLCSAGLPRGAPPAAAAARARAPPGVPPRRGALLGLAGACAAPGRRAGAEEPAAPAPLAGKTRLQQRFLSEDLEKIPSGYVDLFGPADVFYPDWMEGRWQVEQTLGKYTAPLGKKFLGATPERVLAEEQKRLGTPISFELRYVRTARGNLVEDRAFNVRSRLDAFAGKKVVREVTYADVPNFGREDMMKKGDGPNDPLLTVVIQFKGATQKQFITRFLTELGDDGNVFRVLASQRSLFAIGAEAAVAVDEEVVTSLRRKPDGSVVGRLRLVGFLNPNDVLFFEAADKAVTIADYSLKFTRIPGTGEGAAAPAA